MLLCSIKFSSSKAYYEKKNEIGKDSPPLMERSWE
jgi:hypothetical protein